MARRKKNKIVEKPKIPEYEGFKLGDEVWYVRVDHKIKRGKIVNFHPQDKEPSIALMDIIEGRYQISPVRCCSFDKNSLKNKRWNCKKT